MVTHAAKAASKFCMMIKLDEKNIIIGLTMPPALANSCGANAIARSVCSR